MQVTTEQAEHSLRREEIRDLCLAASKMSGAKRRAFQAEITLKYCAGNARRAEEVFGWGARVGVGSGCQGQV